MAETSSLVRRILDGDKESFRIIVNENQRLVSHIVFRMVYNKTDREDLCQEVFLKVYKNLSQFHFGAKISSWIARITYNTCLDFLKKKKHPASDTVSFEDVENQDLTGDYTSPDESVKREEMSTFLHREIEMMPPNYQTILTLYHLEDLSYTEISKIMQIPEGTVKSHLFRARKLLKERLTSKYQKENL
ncbi:MAG: sigma-70 family RNA polymerase sigma factor [candidate division Zixibacteria bacterium]|nr:sigma-70 family RNA polymerase sigma factor [candidate division Zixibacteria bacterium]